MATNELNDAIRDLVAQKDEHRDLVRQIAADPGMDPALRETLLAHIYEEESEKVQELQSLAGAKRPSPAGSAPPRGLTVGSLRATYPSTPGASVGSLRGL